MLLHRHTVLSAFVAANDSFLIIKLRVCVLVDSFTVWPVDPYHATWLWTNQMSAFPCVSATHPIVWGALWGAEVTRWRTWGGLVSFLPGTHGICRRAICRVFDKVWSSVAQHEGRAFGPARLSSVQLETLDRPPQTEDLMDWWSWPDPDETKPGRTKQE